MTNLPPRRSCARRGGSGESGLQFVVTLRNGSDPSGDQEVSAAAIAGDDFDGSYINAGATARDGSIGAAKTRPRSDLHMT
jgi:hypothetical protein